MCRDSEDDDHEFLSARREAIKKKSQEPSEKSTDSTAAKDTEVVGTSQAEKPMTAAQPTPEEPVRASSGLVSCFFPFQIDRVTPLE